MKIVHIFSLLGMVCLVFYNCDNETRTETTVQPYIHAENPVEAGRYLIVVSGCNDCHTDGYLFAGGNIPESEWLTGSSMGWRGPWGTTYPGNLRLRAQEWTEDQWVQMLHTRKALPPMAWPSVNHMSEQDLRAMHAYIKSLGPRGEHAPVAVAADQEPVTPYLSLYPQNMPGGAGGVGQD